MTRWQQRLGALSYLLGALAFNVNTVGSFVASAPWQEQLLIWVPGIFGSIGFVIGGGCECYLNQVHRCSLRSSAHWLAVMNFLGGLLFLMAATMGSAAIAPSRWLVDLPYCIGSAAFGTGSLFGLWMWKCEQYGLALIPQINLGLRTNEPDEQTLSMHAQYGCGRSSASQLPWLALYMINASTSVAGIGLVLCAHLWKYEEGIESYHQVAEAFLNFALSHGILLLGSVVHHVPTARPHSWLLLYMRGVLLLYTANSGFNVYLLTAKALEHS